ncbi:hypothetical protein CMI42_04125 [Candidatus Pacearchaeota archaeon]|nr:hypothetical protein [Candidatus Pacearchaeota archaeon]
MSQKSHFSCCLYNLWALVNIYVGLSIYGRIKNKSIITAKMFVITLYKIQIEYWDKTKFSNELNLKTSNFYYLQTG